MPISSGDRHESMAEQEAGFLLKGQCKYRRVVTSTCQSGRLPTILVPRWVWEETHQNSGQTYFWIKLISYANGTRNLVLQELIILTIEILPAKSLQVIIINNDLILENNVWSIIPTTKSQKNSLVLQN